jgi:hypothetical protein
MHCKTTTQKAETLMKQAAKVIDVDFKQNAVNAALHTQNAHCNALYTVKELEEILKVKNRTIFNYLKIVKEAHPWEDESIFSPEKGKYTECCLKEMQLVQLLGKNEYTKQASLKAEKYSPAAGELVKVEVIETPELLQGKPLPEIPVIKLNPVNTSQITTRTQQLNALDQQLSDGIERLIVTQAQGLVGEAIAEIRELVAEVKVKAKAEVVKQLQGE